MAPRRSALAALIAVAIVASISFAAPASAVLRTRKFETPKGKVTCLLGRGLLRCDVRPELQPQPEKECELDWVGLLLPRHDKARPNCAGDTVGSANRVLGYGEKWKRSGRVCHSKRSGLVCWNNDGYHFKLSKGDWRRWRTA